MAIFIAYHVILRNTETNLACSVLPANSGQIIRHDRFQLSELSDHAEIG